MDCTEAGKEVCGKHGIQGYPTLKIFKNGEVSQEYNGPREAAGIVKYMRAQVGPASKDLLTVAAFDTFLKVPDSAVLGFFAKESDMKATFLKFSDSHREQYRFGHSTAAEVLAKAGEEDAIVLYRAIQLRNKFEADSIKFEGSTKVELDAFVKANVHGLVGHRTRENTNDFKNPLVTAYYAVDYIKNVKGTNYWRNRVLKVAKEFTGQMAFAVSSKDEFQHELNECRQDYTGEKQVVLACNALDQKFIMRE